MMTGPADSGEDDDRANLISGVVNHRTRAPFQIDDIAPPSSRASRVEKRSLLSIIIVLLLALILALLVLLLLLLFNSRNARIEDSRSSNPLSLDRVRESELQTLSLLKQQEFEIFRIWSDTSTTLLNQSDSSSVNDSVMSNSSLVNYNLALEALRSRVFGQISLSRRIQNVLLSSHEGRGENVVDLSENYTDASLLGLDRCGKVDRRLLGRRTVEWNPRSGKYLFAICVSGQMSNHLICLEKHMFFAALLGRVLVIPSSKVDYTYQRVLDIEHINRCLERKAVVTFEEFAESEKDRLRIDKFMCYFSLPKPCYVDDDHVKKLKEELGMSLSKVEAVWEEDVKEPKKRSVKDVLAKFTSDAGVVAIGDVFFADLEEEWFMQPGGPIAHNCKTLIEPSRLILLTAQRFVQTFFGKDFVALQFRRHGFLKFCNPKQASCFYPVPQAAECINRVLERVNSPVIYLSTDAAESKTGLLQSLVVWNGKTVPLVQRPAHDAAEKWDALLYRRGLDGDVQVDTMLDKTICALSTVFIGSPGSTFTEDILRLRKDWGSASLCDEYLCQGELPNFIAEDE